MGSSAKHRRRPARVDSDPNQLPPDAFDEVDDDDPLEDLPPALLSGEAVDDLDLDVESDTTAPRRAQPQRRRARPAKSSKPARATLSDDDLDLVDDWEPPERDRDRKRVEVSEPFKCRHCRAFVGIPPTGGRNRNHCPLCLYSLHVDGKTPGDRASECRSQMAPVGTFYRPNLEQVVVHRCLGCGFLRYNRVAADDNPLLLAQLPVMSPDELAAAAGDDS